MRSTITLEKSFVSQHSVHITDVVFIFRLIVDSILSVGQLTLNAQSLDNLLTTQSLDNLLSMHSLWTRFHFHNIGSISDGAQFRERRRGGEREEASPSQHLQALLAVPAHPDHTQILRPHGLGGGALVSAAQQPHPVDHT